MAMISGPLAVNFWFFEVLLGMLIPFAIILITKGNSIKAALFAAISAFIGIFFMRYDLVIAGQLVPMREPTAGSRVQGVVNGLATYTPSAAEVTIVVGAIVLCAGLYLAAERFLNLAEE
jgi:molybdopterin-containing oxidoreductase family membrane subunit